MTEVEGYALGRAAVRQLAGRHADLDRYLWSAAVAYPPAGTPPRLSRLPDQATGRIRAATASPATVAPAARIPTVPNDRRGLTPAVMSESALTL